MGAGFFVWIRGVDQHGCNSGRILSLSVDSLTKDKNSPDYE